MRTHLLVCPDTKTWRASDELGSTLAAGEWTVNDRTHVVKVEIGASACSGGSAKDRRFREQMTRAVGAVVQAMRAHE